MAVNKSLSTTKLRYSYIIVVVDGMRTVPRLTLTRGQFPDLHFPDGNFPNGHFPEWTISRPDTSPKDTSPTGYFPTRAFPRTDISLTGHLVDHMF